MLPTNFGRGIFGGVFWKFFGQPIESFWWGFLSGFLGVFGGVRDFCRLGVFGVFVGNVVLRGGKSMLCHRCWNIEC